MAKLKFKSNGKWESIAAFKGEDGKDGAIQYTAGKGITIENDTISAEVDKQYVDEVIANAGVPLQETYARKLVCTENEYNNLDEAQKEYYTIIIIKDEDVVIPDEPGTLLPGEPVYVVSNYSDEPIENFSTLSYIENTGNSFINTDVQFKSQNTYKSSLTFSISDSANSGEGGREGWMIGFYEGFGWRAGIQDYDSNPSTHDSFLATDSCFTYTYDGSNYTDELKLNTQIAAESEPFMCENDLQSYVTLFICNESNTAMTNRKILGKLYGCKIWENDILIRDFVPMLRKSDNKPGLYDIVNNRFYMNIHEGEFSYE